MESQKFIKARLTIQQFTLPSTQRDSKTNPRNTMRRSKIFFSNSNFERKHHSSNPEIGNFKNIRHIKNRKQKIDQQDQFFNNLINLPEIDDKQKVYSSDKNNTESKLNSYNSAKLIIKSHSRLQRQKNDERYKNKMQIVKQTQDQSNFFPYQKKMSINHIKSEREISNEKNILESIRKISKQKLNRKAFHFNMIQKNHLNRLKNEDAIPLELQTQRYFKKQRDDDNVNLQLKNYMRFKFDNDMYQGRDKRDKKNRAKDPLGLIDGWGVEMQTIGGTPFYY